MSGYYWAVVGYVAGIASVTIIWYWAQWEHEQAARQADQAFIDWAEVSALHNKGAKLNE